AARRPRRACEGRPRRPGRGVECVFVRRQAWNKRMPVHERRGHARQACKREEREAVRGAQGQGDVEGGGGGDRELARGPEPRRQEVPLLVEEQLVPGRDARSEGRRRSQGRQGDREEELTGTSVLFVAAAPCAGPRPRRTVRLPLSAGR